MTLVLLDSIHFEEVKPGATLRARVTGSEFTFVEITSDATEGDFIRVTNAKREPFSFRVSHFHGIVMREKP
jgi:hypothetical protein